MYKVTKKFRIAERLYRPGDIYEGERGAVLIQRGLVVLSEPVHLGGGWYLYPDGRKGRKPKCEEQ